MEYCINEQRDLPVHLICILIICDCKMKFVLTSEFRISLCYWDQNMMSVSGVDNCRYVRVFNMDKYRVLAGTISQGWLRQDVGFSDNWFRQFLLLLSEAERLPSVDHLGQNLIKIFIF